MNDAALFNLLLAVVGLPATVGGVALLARHLVERHADAYHAAVQRAAAEHQAAEHRAAVARLIGASRKELTR